MKKLILLLSLSAIVGTSSPSYAKKSVKEKNINIVFIGNSITQGVKLGAPEYAPPAIAAELLAGYPGIANVEFFNNGISGKTTFDHLPGTQYFTRTIEGADRFSVQKDGLLVFSIMIGTNDSAVYGPNGAPVEKEVYILNLMSIIDSLFARYPESMVVIHKPIWYSPNTYNTSKYLQEGLDRLKSYLPTLDMLSYVYRKSGLPVYVGDTRAHSYFEKKHKELMLHEDGQEGLFFLHPNRSGARKLGEFWAEGIYKALKKSGKLKK